MKFLVVNYHYIGDEVFANRGIHPISPELFREQLIKLGSLFSFVSQDDVVSAISGKRPLPEYSCLVTFDDGLRNQYEKALPILEELKIPAIFFVNGLPYVSKDLLHIHKLHWCRAHLPADLLIREVSQEFSKRMGIDLDILRISPPDQELRRLYFYDDIETARLKYILSKGVIPKDVEEEIISHCFKKLIRDPGSFAGEWYMDEKQIRDLYGRGMLGSHGFRHDSLLVTNPPSFSADMADWHEVMSEILGESPKISSISYPYGHVEKSTEEQMGSILKPYGIKAGFIMRRAFNKDFSNPFVLSRLDTNDVPLGKSPLFEVSREGVTITSDRFIQ